MPVLVLWPSPPPSRPIPPFRAPPPPPPSFSCSARALYPSTRCAGNAANANTTDAAQTPAANTAVCDITQATAFSNAPVYPQAKYKCFIVLTCSQRTLQRPVVSLLSIRSVTLLRTHWPPAHTCSVPKQLPCRRVPGMIGSGPGSLKSVPRWRRQLEPR